jgi:hypothetical protein
VPGENVGPRGQADDPLDLVRQAKCFGVADGRGQHIRSGAFVAGSGQHIGGGDPLDDAPLRGGRPVIGCEALREVNGLADPTGSEQTAEANLPNGERVKQDFLPPCGAQDRPQITEGLAAPSVTSQDAAATRAAAGGSRAGGI